MGGPTEPAAFASGWESPAVRNVTPIPARVGRVLVIGLIFLVLSGLGLLRWSSNRSRGLEDPLPPGLDLLLIGFGVWFVAAWVVSLRTRSRMQSYVGAADLRVPPRAITIEPVWATGRRFPRLGVDITDGTTSGWAPLPGLAGGFDPTAELGAAGPIGLGLGVVLWAPECGQLIVSESGLIDRSERKVHPLSDAANRVLGWDHPRGPGPSPTGIFELPAEGTIPASALIPSDRSDVVLRLAQACIARLQRITVWASAVFFVALVAVGLLGPRSGLWPLVVVASFFLGWFVVALAQNRWGTGPLADHIAASEGLDRRDAEKVAMMVLIGGVGRPEPTPTSTPTP